jgi:hypothetical protein
MWRSRYNRVVHSDKHTANTTIELFGEVAESLARKYAPGASEEQRALSDAELSEVFQRGVPERGLPAYDPHGTVEMEDREKLVLMRRYIAEFHAKTQDTIALWESENEVRRPLCAFGRPVLTEIYRCNVCSCQEILRRNGRG